MVSINSPLLRFLHLVFVDAERCILPFLAIFATLLCAAGALIIKVVPYTEIDWKAYMQQIELIKEGERDYYNIRGVTGPLVYPAAHVYIYSALHSLVSGATAARGAPPLPVAGTDVASTSPASTPQAIHSAQWIFLAFLVGNAVVIGYLCIKYLQVPKFYFFFLLLSKRMWSLCVLRLFNDAPAMLIAHLALLMFAHEQLLVGCTLYSVAVGCKMNVLLMAPGLAYETDTDQFGVE